MSEEELVCRLTADLMKLKIPIEEVDLYIRPYSKTYYGRYFPSEDENVKKPRVFIYPYENKCGKLYKYELILVNLIHEMAHHIQYTSSSFTRLKGVMHDPNFWKLNNRYLRRAVDFNMIGGEYLEKSKCAI